MLNESKGNMYDFVTHTWNTIKGECSHDCSYCYMKRWGAQKPVRFDEKELKTDLGDGNYIFVGSSCDMFARNVFDEWVIKTLRHCAKYPDNGYFFQSKNPSRMALFEEYLKPLNPIICTTIETNRWYPDFMQNSPPIDDRIFGMRRLKNFDLFVTIEPIMAFDHDKLVKIIKIIGPKQVNLGADSGSNNLPEPTGKEVSKLVTELTAITKVELKKNFGRLKA